jgi:hypothetical protein
MADDEHGQALLASIAAPSGLAPRDGGARVRHPHEVPENKNQGHATPP